MITLLPSGSTERHRADRGVHDLAERYAATLELGELGAHIADREHHEAAVLYFGRAPYAERGAVGEIEFAATTVFVDVGRLQSEHVTVVRDRGWRVGNEVAGQIDAVDAGQRAGLIRRQVRIGRFLLMENDRVAFAILAHRHEAHRRLHRFGDLAAAVAHRLRGTGRVADGEHHTHAGLHTALGRLPQPKRRAIGQMEFDALLALHGRDKAEGVAIKRERFLEIHGSADQVEPAMVVALTGVD